MSILAASLCLLASTTSCKSKEVEETSKGNPAETETPAVEPPSEPSSPAIAKPDESKITWIENDWPGALERAKSAGKPIVIDMWADWCHTCLAMKKGTLRDRGLSAVSGDYVWLSIDTEDPTSARVMELFPPKVWPTFFVVSPVDSSVQASLAGSAAVREFREFIERGAQGHRAALSGDAVAVDSPLAHLRDGDRAWMKGQHQEAAKQYAAALKVGGEAWPHTATTIKNLTAALAKSDDKLACARLAQEHLDFMTEQHNSSGTDFMYYASTCAGALEPLAAEAFRDKLIRAMRDILRDPEAALSYDDRSETLATCRAVANSLGYQDLAATFALKQRTLLAKAVAEAATPLEEMTYAWHQVEVHAYLGKGFQILPWIEELEAKLPNEYDPPYRRAWLLLELKRYGEAHEAIARALTRSKGARRGRILGLDAEIYKAEGNTEKEREARQAIVTHYEGLASGLATAKKLEDARAALAAMDTKPAAKH